MASKTFNTGTVIDAAWLNDVNNAVYNRVFTTIISVKEYGAVGDDTTDDTAAFQNAAAKIKAMGGGIIMLEPGKTYRVLPTGGTSGGKLMDFANCKGLVIWGNGALIHTGSVTLTQKCVSLEAVNGAVISNLRFASDYQVLASNAGIDWIVASWGAQNIIIENVDFQYGVTGFVARGAYVGEGDDTNRCRNIVVNNLTSLGTYYPLHAQAAGDNMRGNIRTRNAGRSFFIYNVKNVDVQVDSQHGGPFSDVLLKVYGSTSWYSRLENVKVRYSSNGRYAGSGNQSANEALVALDFQLNGTNPAACQMQDIDITFDVDASVSDKMQSLFIARKYDSSGAADTTGSRGHNLINLTLRGTCLSLQNLAGDAVRLFTRSPDNWAGESIYNVNVDGLILGSMSGSQNAMTIDGNGLSGSCSVRGVVTGGNLTYSNMSGKDFAVDSSTFGNYSTFTRAAKAYTPVWTAATTNPTLGSGTLAGRYTVRGKLCTVTVRLDIGATSTTGSGNWSISLPFAHSADDLSSIGSVKALDSGTQYYNGTCEVQPGASTLQIMVGGTAGNFVNATTPITWASGDYIQATVTYPIA